MVMQIKRSNTATSVPSSLSEGELAVNVTDKKLYTANATTVVELTGFTNTNVANNGLIINWANNRIASGNLFTFTTGGLGYLGIMQNAGVVQIGNATAYSQISDGAAVVQSNSLVATQQYWGGTTEFYNTGWTTSPGASGDANTGRMTMMKWANRPILTYVDATGYPIPLQTAFHRNGVAFWQALNGNNSPSTGAWGGGGSISTGSFTRTQATSNSFVSMRRLSIQTSGGASGTSNAVRITVLQWFLGNVANTGGFFFAVRGGLSQVGAQDRMFIGMKDSISVLTNGNPSAQTNIIGFGFDSTQTTWRAISANSSAANTIDMGAGFPCNSGNTNMYDFIIYAPPNSTNVNYQIVNLIDGNTVSGAYNTTNLPAVNTLMAWQVWVNNGSATTNTTFDMCGYWVESWRA